MRYALLTVIVFTVMAGSARADMFDVKNLLDREKVIYQFRYKNIDLANPAPKPFVQRYQTAGASKKAVYESWFAGEGPKRHLEARIIGHRYNGYKTELFYKYKPGKRMVLSSLDIKTFHPSGKKIRYEYFDYTQSIPPYPKDMTHPMAMPMVIRGLEYKPGNKRRFYLCFSPEMIFAAELVVKGVEQVKVPAGTFQCHRIEVAPDLTDLMGPIVGKLLKRFVGKYIMWVDTKPPNRLVKYRGPFGMVNLGSGPTEIYELSKIVE